MNKIKWSGVVLVSVLLVAGCSEEPKWKLMYDDCKEQVNASLAEVKQDKNTQAMGEMVQSMGMAACEIIKSTCEDNEEGFSCKALVDSRSDEE